MALDAFELEILRHKTVAAAEEMGLTLLRSARTIYVREVADFGTCLCGIDGKPFAYPSGIGLSAFVDLDLAATLAAVGPLKDGDVILSNLPYANGGLSTHLPDLQLVRPIFHAGEIIAYGWAMAHTSDVGGAVPSSISPDFTDVYQEGLQLPPIRLVREGEMDPDLLAVYLANCRSPDTNLGDVRAMIGALEAGARRLGDIIAVHGAQKVIDFQTGLADYAAAKASAVLKEIPEGDYDFWDYLDHDFTSNVPLRLRVRLSVRPGAIGLDFSGTDPQVQAAYNLPTADQRNPYLTLRFLQLVCTRDTTMPLNHGALRSVTASAPKGSVLNPEYPAACGVRHAVLLRLIDLVSGALHKASPTLVPAAGGGSVLPVVLAQTDEATGRRKSAVIQSIICGGGARHDGDGVDGRESGMSNTRNSPIETTEAAAPVAVELYGLRPDSGGAGRWRGGLGLVYRIRMLKPDLAILARGLERFRFTPWGVQGGRAATPSRVILNEGRADERDITRLTMLPVKQGDTLTFMTPGGGGFGEPFDRPAEVVLRDVARGFVSPEAARRDYGVALDADGGLDAAETDRLRAAPRPEPRAFDFGTERDVWDALVDDAMAARLNAALAPLPASARSPRRRQLIETAVPELTDNTRLGLSALTPRLGAARLALEEGISALHAETHRAGDM